MTYGSPLAGSRELAEHLGDVLRLIARPVFRHISCAIDTLYQGR